MMTALDRDLKKLQARAFDRADWAENVLRRYHAAIQNFDDKVTQELRVLYQWMFVPTTLWPFNVQDVLEDCLAVLEKGKRLTDGIARILFTTGEHRMILLHGFIKKSQKTPREDLELAKTRLRMLL